MKPSTLAMLRLPCSCHICLKPVAKWLGNLVVVPWISRHQRCPPAPWALPAPSAQARRKRANPDRPCFDAGSKRTRGPSSDTAIDMLVGPCSETRADHLRRHEGGRNTCIRCRYSLYGDAWTATYGSFAMNVGGTTRRQMIWLSEKPAHWGGAWRVGCCVCAEFEQRRSGAKSSLKR